MPAKTKAKKVSTKSTPSKTESFQSVKGMHDLLPAAAASQEKIFKEAREILEYYNFGSIVPPLVEPLGLYARTTGEATDIVEKQMFAVKTKSAEQLALRPEFTPGICRAYVQHGMAQLPHPVKLYTMGPVFRYEQPQAGRLRQFNQIDAEIFSTENDAVYDAQGILAAYRILEELKIKDALLSINTIGCKTCRPVYRKALITYYKNKERQLCADCKRRLTVNPLRLLDCKTPDCQPLKENAPTTLDHVCAACKKHFKEVIEYLDNLKLPYALNNFLVRGLDYYSKTVFEVTIQPQEGEEHLSFALGGGGRYDYLIEELGGKPTAAFGWALGVERITEVLRHRNLLPNTRTRDKVFLIHIGEMAKKQSLCLIETLRQARIGVIESLGKESLAAQLRSADKAGVSIALIFGQKEAYEESIIIRDMKTGAQEMVPLTKLAEMIKRKLG